MFLQIASNSLCFLVFPNHRRWLLPSQSLLLPSPSQPRAAQSGPGPSPQAWWTPGGSETQSGPAWPTSIPALGKLFGRNDIGFVLVVQAFFLLSVPPWSARPPAWRMKAVRPSPTTWATASAGLAPSAPSRQLSRGRGRPRRWESCPNCRSLTGVRCRALSLR